MPRQITKYQAADGKEFNTEQAAIQHEEDLLGAKLDAFFIHWLGDSPRHAIYKAVCTAVSNKALLTAQLQEMVRILQYIELHQEEED